MSVKVKDMWMPGNCASCPLLILDSYGYRRCFVTDDTIRDYMLDDKPGNCPLEECED